jgi:hypothetical protein
MDGPPPVIGPRAANARTNVVQHLRSILPGQQPGPGTMIEGEFAVGMQDPMSLWVGVPTGIDPTGRKQFLFGTITVGDTAPANAEQGRLWWSSTDTQLYVFYQDPTGPGQWVVAVNPSQPTGTATGIPEAPADGTAYGRMNQAWVRVVAHDGDTIDGGNF